MKIAFSVTTSESGLNAPIDPRFGRARYFLIVNTDDEAVIKTIDNSSVSLMGHGAGIKAAGTMVDEGVEAVASGFVGPKAFSVLKAAGIRVYSGLDGTVKEALDKIKKDAVRPDQGPSTNGHW